MLWGERFGRITPLIFHPSSPTITLGKTLMHITPFNFNSQEIRTVQHDDGSIWFVAKDVCGALDVGNPSQSLSRLDDDETSDVILNDGSQKRCFKIINESGLYSVTLSSRKPEAKAIKRILEENNVKISAIAANKLLMAEGLLEEKERPSTGDKVKKFKSVTGRGLEFGKNVPNPKNERETTPLWYVDTSKELLEKIGI